MRRRIIFRVDGYKELGLGHIYNCLTLAEIMPEHELLFVTDSHHEEGLNKLKESGYPLKCIKSFDDIDAIIESFDPDIWINDCLNTEKEYVLRLKKKINRVISIEDIGEGSRYTDATINAMYEDDRRCNIFSGWKYVCLRDEFQKECPRKFSSKVETVVLMFGGTDPSNYNKMLYDIIDKIAEKYPYISFKFITGYGYDAEINGIVSEPAKNIWIYPNVQKVTEYMKEADIAITSQGRTIFELAAMGVPSIVLAQNEREQTHTFAQMDHGFLNLGLKDLSPDLISNTLDWLINTPPIRKNMYDLMTKLPLREGIGRVKKIIVGDE